jgi:hypothetical protein
MPMRTLNAIVDDIDSDLAQIEEIAQLLHDTAEALGPLKEGHPCNGRIHFCAKVLSDYAARLYEATERLRSVNA